MVLVFAFLFFFFSSRRRHTRSVSAFLLNRSSDLQSVQLLQWNSHIKFNLTIPLQQLNGLETLVIIMVANKYAFLQITRRRFLKIGRASCRERVENCEVTVRAKKRRKAISCTVDACE